MLRRIRARLGDERGFTLIELLVAAGICLVGLMAIMSTFDGSRGLVTAAERNEVASHRAQRAIEEAVSLPYGQIALAGTTFPAASADVNHPSYLVRSGGVYRWRTAPVSDAPFVMGGSLEHKTPWSDSTTDARMTGETYRYVTVYDDPHVAGADNGRRVTAAVTVEGRRKAVTATTIVRNKE